MIIYEKKMLWFIFFLIFYLISYVGGYFLSTLVDNIVLRLFIFDVSATVFIWIFSLFIKNSSLYDAYWSLTPLVMIIYLYIINAKFSIYHILFLIAFSLWAVRLTVNWIITFKDIKWIDWRYKKYKEENKFIVWHIINFFGIMMMPTLFVFISFIPAIYITAIDLNVFSIIGILIILLGFSLELVADHEMHSFLKLEKETKVTCRKGLWKYSRHPNYLGEICVWIGVSFTLLWSHLELWYLCLGFLIMIFLFEVVSIPLMEKRQLVRRSDYIEYKKTTSRLLLLPNRKNK